jgi:hypothetical protein
MRGQCCRRGCRRLLVDVCGQQLHSHAQLLQQQAKGSDDIAAAAANLQASATAAGVQQLM